MKFMTAIQTIPIKPFGVQDGDKTITYVQHQSERLSIGHLVRKKPCPNISLWWGFSLSISLSKPGVVRETTKGKATKASHLLIVEVYSF